MIIHGQLDVVLPEAQGPAGVNDGGEDPVEDEGVQEEEQHQSDHGGGVSSVEGVLSVGRREKRKEGGRVNQSNPSPEEARHASRNADSACPFLPSQKGAR